MKFRISSPLLWIVLATIIGFVLHKVFCYLWIPKVYEAAFLYSILELYLGFGLFSVLLLFVLQLVKKSAIDNVGFTFMGLTCFKMVIAYAFLYWPLHYLKRQQKKLIFLWYSFTFWQ
jgi:hypothetical protein